MQHSFDKKMKRNPLVKTLAKEIRALGYKLSFVPSYRDLGVYNAYGLHHKTLTEKEIQCVRADRLGKPLTVGDVAFVLAHELRHAQHVRQHLYSAYYDRGEDEVTLSRFGISIAVGLRAELDCDRYARERLAAAGMHSGFVHRRYPLRKVSGYLYYRRAQLKQLLLWHASRDADFDFSPIREELKRIRQLIKRDRALCKTEKSSASSSPAPTSTGPTDPTPTSITPASSCQLGLISSVSEMLLQSLATDIKRQMDQEILREMSIPNTTP